MLHDVQPRESDKVHDCPRRTLPLLRKPIFTPNFPLLLQGMLLGLSLIVASLIAFFLWKQQMTWTFLPWSNRAAEARQTEGGADVDTKQNGHTVSNGSAEKGVNELQPPQFTLQEPTNEEGEVEDDASQSTPKAKPAEAATLPTPPSLTIQSHEDTEDEEDNAPVVFPAPNSAQRASGGTARIPTLKPLSKPAQPSAPTSLMPPPRLPASAYRESKNASPGASALRVPTTGPLPNRGPPTSSSLAPPPYKTTNARNKVLLSPGHSPLDWAALQRSGKNLAGTGTNNLIRVTPSQLKAQNGRKGKPAWSVWQGKVYNMTPYVPFHPGGEGQIMRAAGKEGGKLFLEAHPWVNWENMLGQCLVGVLVSEEDGQDAESSLDAMD